MKKGPVVTIASVTLAVGLALTPATAIAGGSRGTSFLIGRPIVTRPFAKHQFVHRPFVHRPFVHHPFAHRPFFRPVVPFGVIGAAPVIVYAPPPAYYGPAPAYYDPPTYYDQPVSYAPPVRATMAVPPAPPPPPTPSVVEYPHGRYELRGDGVTTPYVWVWIPNPPPPPPPPASGDSSSERHSQLYRWTDEQGVVHLTDRWDTIPAQYREQAKRL